MTLLSIRQRMLTPIAVSALLSGFGAPLVTAPASLVTAPASASTTTVTSGANAADCPGGVLAPHAEISITSDAGFTAANGVTGGNGTASDPYVISCWSIHVAGNTDGISIGSTVTKSFSIINDAFAGSAAGSSSAAVALSSGGPAASANVTVKNVTVTAVANGYADGFSNGAQGTVTVDSNLIDGGNLDGAGIATGQSSPQTTVASNVISGVSDCIHAFSPATGTTSVQGNNCAAGTNQASGGVGIAVSTASSAGSMSGNPAQTVASGNEVEGFETAGVEPQGATLTNNIIRQNAAGIVLPGGAAILNGNQIENNAGAGIDITDAFDSLITGNTILNNGSAGILANISQSHDFQTASNLVDGNTVGGSPFGIAFAYGSGNNTVQNTHWADGHQSFVRSGDTDTIADAGSAVRGVAGSPASFHDWIIHVVPGSIAPSSCGSSGCTGTTVLASATGATFAFGDGTSQSISPSQFSNTGALLTHAYAAPGTYTAKLTVNATDSAGNPVTLTGTTPVTIVSPTPTTALLPPPAGQQPWPMLGNTPDRPFYNGQETTISKSTVKQLALKWRVPTTYPVTAAPAVATVNLPTVPGGTPAPTKMVFDGTFDGSFYAINDGTGLPIWKDCLVSSSVYVTSEASCDPSFPGNPNAQTDYGAITASPEVVTLPNGTQEVLAAANATMNAINPATGKILWSFTGGSYVQANEQTTGGSASTSCVPPGTSGAAPGSPYDIESSPVVVGTTVYFGMDSNAECDQGGGIYAINAADGSMEWFFDPAAGRVFYPPNATTRSWDPHDDLVNGQLVPGGTCGGVWTSPAADSSRGLLFASSANCPQDPIPPYDEAAFALNLTTGQPVWHYQPRQIDSLDMDFGATPNVLTLGSEHVVGFASKDGTYSMLGAAKGTVIWTTKAALGGSDGGFYNSTTDGTNIYVNSAIGETGGTATTATEESLKGREYALDARTGNVIWRSFAGAANLEQDSAVNGVYFTGGLDHFLHAFDTSNGNLLYTFPLGGAASGPAIAGGELFVGAGTGTSLRAAAGCCDPLTQQIAFPHPIPIYEYGQGIYGFCIASNPDCANALGKLNAGRDPAKLTYTGQTSGDPDDPVTFSATLDDTASPLAPSPVQGRSVTFSISPTGPTATSSTRACTATTDSNGNASCQITLNQPAGTSTVTTTFPGDSSYQESSTQTSVTVNHEETTLTYAGDTSVEDGGTAHLSALLEEDGTAPVQGRAVTFTLGSGPGAQHCDASTGPDGRASCTITPVAQPAGAGTVAASFAGDGFFAPASASATVTELNDPPLLPSPHLVGPKEVP